jgi:hypothetical protein
MKKFLFLAFTLLAVCKVPAADWFLMDANAFKMVSVTKINGIKMIDIMNGLFPNYTSTISKYSVAGDGTTEPCYVHEIYYDPTAEDNLNQALALILNAQSTGQQLIVYGTYSVGVINATKIFSKAN